MGVKGYFEANIFDIGELLVKGDDGSYNLPPDIIDWLVEMKVPHIVDIRPGAARRASTITILDDTLSFLFKLSFHNVVPFTI